MAVPTEPEALPRASIVEVALALVGIGLLVGGFFFQQRQSELQATAQVTREPWPTLQATFTPLPTATLVPSPTAVPAPTPIVINQRAVAELAVMEITVSAVQSIKSDDARLGGIRIPHTSEQVTVEYVARVRLGLDYTQVRYSVDGSTVQVTLPPIKLLSVEPDWSESRIVDTDQRLIGSNTADIQRQAWESASQAITNRVMRDTGLLTTARRYTAYTIEENLRELGFETIIFN